MDGATMSSEDLMPAQHNLFHHLLCYVKSMALKCAVDLGIPNAIHLHGGSATLSDVVAAAGLPLSRKPYVRRLMNLLTISGIFASSLSDAPPGGGGETTVVYQLTPASRVLIDDEHSSNKNLAGRNMATFVRFLVNPLLVHTFFDMHAWLKDDDTATATGAAKPTLFEMAHGCSRHEVASKNADDNALYNGTMLAASRMAMDILLREAAGSDVFSGGITSLVDVGGGHGGASVAIAAAFPHVKCTVLDLPHVVSQARSDDGGTVQFIAGDMFKFIPKADAVLLKWVLHCWGDDDCVKVLRNCKEAILPAERGGKVIIIGAVMGACPQDDIASMETLALYDVYMMHMDGVERDERGWEKIILEAGFRRYKIVSLSGFQSVIEVYP